MTELKPCPLCGQKPIRKSCCEDDYHARVVCKKCRLTVEPLSVLGGKSAVEIWNTRNDKVVIDEFLAAVRKEMGKHSNEASLASWYIRKVYTERYGE